MKNISMAIVGLGLLVAGSAQAANLGNLGNLGNFGPYVGVNSNEANSKGTQIAVSSEGRMSGYAPVEVVKGNTQIAISSEGRLNGYRS
ncbi:MAG: hypothetical protein COB94_006590 [Gammaproteobacteria bacterium]|nr:hypothetical protein [Gammaproteobacteria bacterium]